MEATWLGGPAKNLIEFARRAGQPSGSSPRVELTVATFRRTNLPSSNAFTVACADAGLKVHIIHERFAFDAAIIPAMRRLIAAYDPDIVQTHSVKSHFLLLLTGAHRRHRWIAFHHGYTWTDLKVRLYNRLDHWSLPASSRVVTVCRPFARHLERMGIPPGRIGIQHNAVNPFVPASADTVRSLRERLGIPPRARVLLNVGRLSREKGQVDLIAAMALLRREKQGHDLRLIFVGDGPEKRKLQKAAETAGLSDCVIFAAHQSDVAPFYTLADVVVLPSWTEGSPNVLLEALAAGLPVVATAVGGVPEIVSAANAALLVERRHPAALARRVAEVLDDENLRNAVSRAAQKTATAYSPELYCDSLLNLYRDCMREPNLAPEPSFSAGYQWVRAQQD